MSAETFPFRVITFDDDDKITSGSWTHGGIISREEAVRFAEMVDARVFGILEVATGETELIYRRGTMTPGLERVWAAVQAGRIPHL